MLLPLVGTLCAGWINMMVCIRVYMDESVTVQNPHTERGIWLYTHNSVEWSRTCQFMQVNHTYDMVWIHMLLGANLSLFIIRIFFASFLTTTSTTSSLILSYPESIIHKFVLYIVIVLLLLWLLLLCINKSPGRWVHFDVTMVDDENWLECFDKSG